MARRLTKEEKRERSEHMKAYWARVKAGRRRRAPRRQASNDGRGGFARSLANARSEAEAMITIAEALGGLSEAPRGRVLEWVRGL